MKTDRRALKNHLAVRSPLAADLQLVFNYACIHVQTDTHTHAWIGTVYRILRLVRERVTFCQPRV